MSNPSFSNIDLWLFEYAEGNLSPAQIEQLELFLLQHPELDVDRDVWEMTRLEKLEEVFPHTEKLERRSPVAWYVGGAMAVTSLALLVWWLPGATEQNSGIVATGTEHESLHQRTHTAVQISGIPSIPASNPADLTQEDAAQPAFVAVNNYSEAIPVLLSSSIDTEPVSAHQVSAGQGLSEQPEALLTATMDGQTESIAVENIIEPIHDNISNISPVAWEADHDEHVNARYYSHVSKIPILHARPLAVQTGFPEEPIASVSYSTENFPADGFGDEGDSRAGNGYATFSSDYHNSFKSRVSAFGRKLQRMMDNPVALKNFRDPYYHVPGMLPNDICFSATGTRLSTRVQTLSRLQWYGQENEQLMNQLSVDGYAYALRGGVGVQVNHGLYRHGGMSISDVAITYSPKLSVSKTISLEPSLRFKMGNTTMAHSKMQDVERVEVERGNDFAFFPNGNQTGKMLWYQDLGAGLMVNTEWFFVGAQLDNLFRHYDNVYAPGSEYSHRADYHFIGTIGTDWVSRRENLSLSPYLVYQHKERLSEAWLGANFRWNWLTVGAAISSGKDPSASIGLKFDHFALTYSADYTKSVMTGQPSLSHQLTLRFVSKPSQFGRRLLNL